MKDEYDFSKNTYGERDEHLDYLCEVDISQADYVIKLIQWGKGEIFNGTLDAFVAEHGEQDD